ncbi:hypothetical protein HN451_07665, partial [archaeon]|nr:hypothetical protein [archaeon]
YNIFKKNGPLEIPVTFSTQRKLYKSINQRDLPETEISPAKKISDIVSSDEVYTKTIGLPPEGLCFDLAEIWAIDGDGKSVDIKNINEGPENKNLFVIENLNIIINREILKKEGFIALNPLSDGLLSNEVLFKDYSTKKVTVNEGLIEINKYEKEEFGADFTGFNEFGVMINNMFHLPSILNTEENVGLNHPAKILPIFLKAIDNAGIIMVQPCNPISIDVETSEQIIDPNIYLGQVGTFTSTIDLKTEGDPNKRTLTFEDKDLGADLVKYHCQPNDPVSEIESIKLTRTKSISDFLERPKSIMYPYINLDTRIGQIMKDSIELNSIFYQNEITRDNPNGLYHEISYVNEDALNANFGGTIEVVAPEDKEYLVRQNKEVVNSIKLSGVFPTIVQVMPEVFIDFDGNSIRQEINPNQEVFNIQPISPKKSAEMVKKNIAYIWNDPEHVKEIKFTKEELVETKYTPNEDGSVTQSSKVEQYIEKYRSESTNWETDPLKPYFDRFGHLFCFEIQDNLLEYKNTIYNDIPDGTAIDVKESGWLNRKVEDPRNPSSRKNLNILFGKNYEHDAYNTDFTNSYPNRIFVVDVEGLRDIVKYPNPNKILDDSGDVEFIEKIIEISSVHQSPGKRPQIDFGNEISMHKYCDLHPVFYPDDKFFRGEENFCNPEYEDYYSDILESTQDELLDLSKIDLHVFSRFYAVSAFFQNARPDYFDTHLKHTIDTNTKKYVSKEGSDTIGRQVEILDFWKSGNLVFRIPGEPNCGEWDEGLDNNNLGIADKKLTFEVYYKKIINDIQIKLDEEKRFADEAAAAAATEQEELEKLYAIRPDENTILGQQCNPSFTNPLTIYNGRIERSACSCENIWILARDKVDCAQSSQCIIFNTEGLAGSKEFEQCETCVGKPDQYINGVFCCGTVNINPCPCPNALGGLVAAGHYCR